MSKFKKEFIDLHNAIARQGFNKHEVFCDFCEVNAIAISNRFDMVRFEKREARYFEILAKYGSDNMLKFSEMLAITITALNTEISDFLGEIFMSLELGNDRTGQFFTPYTVSYLMASCSVDAYEVMSREFSTILDPCIGAGSTTLGACGMLQNHLKAKGAPDDVRYQDKIHITGVDIDYTAVCMAYIQLSALDIPAILIHGDSLRLQEWNHFYTPAHIMGGWHTKLKNRNVETTASINIPDKADRQGSFTFDFN